MESFSPEERLLQLIRKRRSKKEETPPSPEKTPSQGSAVPSSPREMAPVGMKRKAPFSFRVEEDKTIRLFRQVNLVLLGVFGVLLALLLTSFVWGKWRPEAGAFSKEALLPQKEQTKTDLSKDEPLSKPYSYYGEEIGKRNIFGPSLHLESEGDSADAEAVRESLKHLALLGIISGKNPQAIIEDKKEGKTHFVNAGDTLGPLRVEEIKEDKVILNYRGERLDLSL